MKRLKNKAQFYLVSAMILATIIIALISITNFSNKKENNQIENYGKELEIEIEKVYDYCQKNDIEFADEVIMDTPAETKKHREAIEKIAGVKLY